MASWLFPLGCGLEWDEPVQLFSKLGIALFIDGWEALGLGGCSFLGLRASLLPLRWLLAIYGRPFYLGVPAAAIRRACAIASRRLE